MTQPAVTTRHNRGLAETKNGLIHDIWKPSRNPNACFVMACGPMREGAYKTKATLVTCVRCLAVGA